MREDKKSEFIHEALEFLDDELLEEVDALRGGAAGVGNALSYEIASELETNMPTEKTGKKRGIYAWRKWAVLAASICLLVVFGGILGRDNSELHDVSGDMNISPEGNIESDVMENVDVENEQERNDAPQDEYKEQDKEQDDGFDQEALLEGMSLRNYVAIYHEDKLLAGEALTVMNKFIEAYYNGSNYIGDDVLSENLEKEADAHLYFEMSDGSTWHIVLMGDGLVYDTRTPSNWKEIDKRIYNTVLKMLKEES